MYVYWILYLVHIGGDYTIYCGHAPRGACELKYIEYTYPAYNSCHAPRGACELKYARYLCHLDDPGHAPRGACELKFFVEFSFFLKL